MENNLQEIKQEMKNNQQQLEKKLVEELKGNQPKIKDLKEEQ
jgi:hypothetical protein